MVLKRCLVEVGGGRVVVGLGLKGNSPGADGDVTLDNLGSLVDLLEEVPVDDAGDDGTDDGGNDEHPDVVHLVRDGGEGNSAGRVHVDGLDGSASGEESPVDEANHKGTDGVVSLVVDNNGDVVGQDKQEGGQSRVDKGVGLVVRLVVEVSLTDLRGSAKVPGILLAASADSTPQEKSTNKGTKELEDNVGEHAEDVDHASGPHTDGDSGVTVWKWVSFLQEGREEEGGGGRDRGGEEEVFLGVVFWLDGRGKKKRKIIENRGGRGREKENRKHPNLFSLRRDQQLSPPSTSYNLM